MTVDLLSRLRPEDVHPARLAGPHAWARWGLGPPPPVDAPLSLAVPASAAQASVERFLDAVQARLVRASWPPRPAIRLARRGRDLWVMAGAARLAVTVGREPGGTSASARPAGTVVDAIGWCILDETGALADRLTVGGRDESLVEDLSRWGALKGDQAAHERITTSTVAMVLTELRHRSPGAAEQLHNLLESLGPETSCRLPPVLVDGLSYLRDEALFAHRSGRPAQFAARQ